MIKDPYEVFPAPPMVAYRRAKNLRDKLIKAKVQEERQLTGIKPCNKSGCEVNSFLTVGLKLKYL